MQEKLLDLRGREPHSMTGRTRNLDLPDSHELWLRWLFRIRPFPEVYDPSLQVSNHGPERI